MRIGKARRGTRTVEPFGELFTIDDAYGVKVHDD
jgi:hypothetical protein